MNNYVLLNTFTDSIDAYLLRTKLELEGVGCEVQDDMLTNAFGFYSNAIGGVKVYVHEDDFEIAYNLVYTEEGKYVLNKEDNSESKDSVTCPKCGSINLTKPNYKRITAFLLLFVGIPYPKTNRKWRCSDCKEAFEETNQQDL